MMKIQKIYKPKATMIPKKTFIFPFVVVILTILSSCLSPTQSSFSPIAPSATIQVSPTTTLIRQTITPTGTFIQIPTLSPDDAHKRLSELLNDSANCSLPCWLGVTPGKSSWQDANEQLFSLSAVADKLYIESGVEKWSLGFLTIPYPNDKIVIEIVQTYPTSLSDRKVSIIGAESRAYKLENGNYEGDIYGYPAYNELLRRYSISSVFSNYGKPSQIYVVAFLRTDTTVTPGFGDHFDLHVWYPDQGIFMKYKMSVAGSGDNYRFCPSDAFASGYFMSSDLTANYKDVLLNLGVYNYIFSPSPYVKTTEEAFGMTEEDFYQIFHLPTDRCLETPKSIWWPK
jgi:hypothetical protein